MQDPRSITRANHMNLHFGQQRLDKKNASQHFDIKNKVTVFVFPPLTEAKGGNWITC
jgi:hypothetical protein